MSDSIEPTRRRSQKRTRIWDDPRSIKVCRRTERREQAQYASDIARLEAESPVLHALAAEEQYCGALVAMLRARGDTTSVLVPQKDWYDVYSEGDRICVCDPTGSTIHSRNNATLKVEAETCKVMIFCFSDRCPTPRLIGTLQPSRTVADNSTSLQCVSVEKGADTADGVVTSDVLASRGYVVPSCATTHSETAVRVHRLLQTLENNHRFRCAHTRTLQIACRYMGEDPRCDAATSKGLQVLQGWGKVVVYKGRQGAGKTHCVTNAAIQYMKVNPGKKVVFVVPFVTLSRAQTTNIAKACGGKRVHVQFYKDPTPKGTDSTWDVLVVCPMSLHKFNLAHIGLLVIDELSAVGTQLVGWVDEKGETGERLSRAVDLLKCLAQQVTTVVLCGAQADAFERERMLALLAIDPSVAMLMYEHVGRGPVIPVARLESTDHAINFMWHYYEQGLKVAIHFRHASDVDCVAVYAQAKAQECGVRPPVLLKWTRESLAKHKALPHPAADVTKYLQATRPEIMAYTTALSPGMSIDDDDLIDVRIMVEPNIGSGAGDKVIGQMPGRFRKVKDQLVLISAPNIGTQRDNGDAIMAMLATTRGADTHTRLSEQGDAECVLKEGLLNDLKLEAFIYASKGISFSGILPHIGNTHVVAVPTPGGVVVSSEPDPLWLKIRKERGHDPDTVIAHLTETEIKYIRSKTNDTVTSGLHRSERALFIARMLPRQFVATGGAWVRRYSLSNATFKLVDVYFHQFMVLQSFVWTMALPGHAGRNVQEGLVEQYAALYSRTAMRITATSELAVLAIKHLCTLACLQSSQAELSVQVYVPKVSDLAQAYSWVSDHWAEVQSLTSKNCILPVSIPARHECTKWLKCVRRVTKKQMGVNMEKRYKKTGRTHDAASTWFVFTAGSMWKTLGVDLKVYIPWLLGEEATTHFMVSPLVYVSCEICDVVNGPVQCLYQGGLARCTTRSTQDCSAHRDMTLPLDTGLQQDFDARVVEDNQTETLEAGRLEEPTSSVFAPVVYALGNSDVNSEHKEQEDVVLTDTLDVLDRLLVFLGFTQGTQTEECVAAEDILMAATNVNNVLSSTHEAQIKQVFGLTVSAMRQWSNVRQITVALRSVAKTAKFRVVNTRIQKNCKRLRAYIITPAT
jgi:hypothetical protein